MLYLLDANVLIDANRDYYPIVRVPEFWAWLVHHGRNGDVKIPLEVHDEIKEGNDDLGAWARDEVTRAALLLDEEANVVHVSRVINEGYARDLTDDEVERIGRDPFLVAYSLVSPDSRCVVTTEASRPTRLRANRHLPDVCKQFNIPCCNTFAFVRALNFRTNWNAASR